MSSVELRFRELSRGIFPDYLENLDNNPHFSVKINNFRPNNRTFQICMRHARMIFQTITTPGSLFPALIPDCPARHSRMHLFFPPNPASSFIAIFLAANFRSWVWNEWLALENLVLGKLRREF